MTTIKEGLYVGNVVHKRLKPVTHTLNYAVFSCLFDVSRLDALSTTSKLFSYNKFNLFSVCDADHWDGKPLCEALGKIADESGRGKQISRFMMLCYPRVLGYVFNPITVYFGLNTNEDIELIIYQVHNTFGEKHAYILPADGRGEDIISQNCDKRFYVSPYNKVEGRYSFHVTKPLDTLTLGVALKTTKGPLLKTYFKGERRPLNDKTLLKALIRTGWIGVKVIIAIHFEALKLWLKGLRFMPKPAPANTSVTRLSTSKETL